MSWKIWMANVAWAAFLVHLYHVIFKGASIDWSFHLSVASVIFLTYQAVRDYMERRLKVGDRIFTYKKHILGGKLSFEEEGVKALVKFEEPLKRDELYRVETYLSSPNPVVMGILVRAPTAFPDHRWELIRHEYDLSFTLSLRELRRKARFIYRDSFHEELEEGLVQHVENALEVIEFVKRISSRIRLKVADMIDDALIDEVVEGLKG